GIVAGPDAPWTADRVAVVAGHDRRRDVALGAARLDCAARHGRDRERALQQREAIGWEFRQVVGEEGEPPRDRDDGGPHLGRGPREWRPRPPGAGADQPPPAGGG